MAYGQNYQAFQEARGLYNLGRGAYNGAQWVGNTAVPWVQGQFAGGAAAEGAGMAGNAAGTAAATDAAATGAGAAGTAAATDAAATAGAAAATDAAVTAAAAPAVEAGVAEAAIAAAPYVAMAFSDRRAKTDIRRVGLLDNGLPVYAYKMKSGGPTQIGLLAQDVRKENPHAVAKAPGGGGLLMVNYDQAVLAKPKGTTK